MAKGVQILNNSKEFVVNVVNVVNDIVKVIDNSSLKDAQTAKTISVAMDNVISVISSMTGDIVELNILLSELNNSARSVDMLYVLGDPKAIMDALQGKPVSKLGPFIFYANLLNIAKQMSDVSKSIDKKALKNSKKNLSILIESVIEVYRELNSHILAIKFFSGKISGEIIKQFSDLTNTIVTLLIGNLQNIAKLTSDGLDKKTVRRAVNAVFSIYYLILWNAFKLGYIIKFLGIVKLSKDLAMTFTLTMYLNYMFKYLEVVIEQIIKLGDSYVASRFGLIAVNNIYVQMIRASRHVKPHDFIGLRLTIAATFMMNTIFNLLQTTINELILLGQNFINANLGIKAVSAIFYGDAKGAGSLIRKLGRVTPYDIQQLALATVAALMLNTIFQLLQPVVQIIIRSGKNFMAMVFGMQSIRLIFSRSRFGLVGILIRRADPRTYAKLAQTIPTVILLSLIMLGLNSVINTLIITGRNAARVRRGIRALRYVLDRLVWMIIKFNISISVKNISEFAAKSAFLFLAFIPITLVILMLGSVAMFAALSIISMLALFVIVSTTLLLVQMINKNARFEKGLARLAALMSGLVFAAAALALIAALSINFATVGAFLVVFSLFVAITAGAAWLLSKLNISILLGSLLLVVLIGSVYLTAIVLEKICELNIEFEPIGQFVLATLAILGMAAAMALGVLYLPFALVGITMYFIMISMMMLIALEMKVLANVDMKDIQGAKDNAKAIFETCNEIIGQFLLNTVAKPEDASSMSFGRQLLQYVGGPIVSIIEAIFSALYVAAIFITITFILLIAVELRLLQELNIDKNAIQKNVADIFDTSKLIMDMLFGDSQTKEGYSDAFDKLGIFGPIFNAVCPPLVPILNAIFAVLNVALIFITITFILLIATELRILQVIDLDESKIRENVEKVINTGQFVTNVIRSSKKSKETKSTQSWWRKALGALPLVGNMTDLIEGIMNIGSLAMTFISIGMISVIAKNLEYIQGINLDTKKITNNLTGPNGILTVANALVTELDKSKTNSISEKKVKAFKAYVDDSVKYMKRINKLDENKLIKYSDLWKEMSNFMEKMDKINVEAIADAIINKIAPAMGDISDNMDKINEKGKNNKPLPVNAPTTASQSPNATDVVKAPQKLEDSSSKPGNKPEPKDYTQILKGIKEALDIMVAQMGG